LTIVFRAQNYTKKYSIIVDHKLTEASFPIPIWWSRLGQCILGIL